MTSDEALGRAELVTAARDTIARGSQSFSAASRLFARPTRERAWLLYCWCRAADDMTDGQELGHSAANKDRGDDRQAELETLTIRAMSGDDPLPIPFAALRQVASETGLPRRFVDDHLAGFALDTAGWRPDSADDLLRYCYHVAGVVGCMMAVVMGVDPDDADTLDRACDQGIAFQLANIARDIVPDAEAGRCYIPVRWLAEFGVVEAEIAAPANRAALATIAARMVALAEPYRGSARIGAGRLPLRSRLAVLAADSIYGAIGERVVGLGAQAWDRRVRIGSAGKAGQLAKAAMRSLARPADTARAGLWARPR